MFAFALQFLAYVLASVAFGVAAPATILIVHRALKRWPRDYTAILVIGVVDVADIALIGVGLQAGHNFLWLADIVSIGWVYICVGCIRKYR